MFTPAHIVPILALAAGPWLSGGPAESLPIAKAALAVWVNSMIPGANYLYMARPESAPSVLDVLPPNYALRIGVMVAVISVMFGLAYLPWYLKDRKAAKAQPTEEE